jgi:hypothetical protein
LARIEEKDTEHRNANQEHLQQCIRPYMGKDISVRFCDCEMIIEKPISQKKRSSKHNVNEQHHETQNQDRQTNKMIR